MLTQASDKVASTSVMSAVNEERVREKLRDALRNLYNSEIKWAKRVDVQGKINETIIQVEKLNCCQQILDV